MLKNMFPNQPWFELPLIGRWWYRYVFHSVSIKDFTTASRRLSMVGRVVVIELFDNLKNVQWWGLNRSFARMCTWFWYFCPWAWEINLCRYPVFLFHEWSKVRDIHLCRDSDCGRNFLGPFSHSHASLLYLGSFLCLVFSGLRNENWKAKVG